MLPPELPPEPASWGCQTYPSCSVKLACMNYADDEKLRLLRWLLPGLVEDEIVAAELAYRDVSRKADLAILSPTRLAAIEIKGPRDRFDSLIGQVEDYLEAFLEVDVAVSTRFLNAARAELPRSVGIIELANDSIVRRRQAAVRKQLSPVGALTWLHAKDLQRLIPDPQARNWDIVTLRMRALQTVRQSELSKAAVEIAWQRSKDRYAAFCPRDESSNVR